MDWSGFRAARLRRGARRVKGDVLPLRVQRACGPGTVRAMRPALRRRRTAYFGSCRKAGELVTPSVLQ
jgi:hypothetical protein